jgi:hypothetical protein
VNASDAPDRPHAVLGAAAVGAVGAALLFAGWVAHVQPLPQLTQLSPVALRIGAPPRIVADASRCRWSEAFRHSAVGFSHVPAGALRELARGRFCRDDAVLEVDDLDDLVRLDAHTFERRFHVDVTDVVTSTCRDGCVETHIHAEVADVEKGRRTRLVGAFGDCRYEDAEPDPRSPDERRPHRPVSAEQSRNLALQELAFRARRFGSRR